MKKRPQRKLDGERCSAPGFGSGTIIKKGPEQSLVVWDDASLNPSASSGAYVPNSWIKEEKAENQ